jgi:hypothetical protein
MAGSSERGDVRSTMGQTLRESAAKHHQEAATKRKQGQDAPKLKSKLQEKSTSKRGTM